MHDDLLNIIHRLMDVADQIAGSAGWIAEDEAYRRQAADIAFSLQGVADFFANDLNRRYHDSSLTALASDASQAAMAASIDAAIDYSEWLVNRGIFRLANQGEWLHEHKPVLLHYLAHPELAVASLKRDRLATIKMAVAFGDRVSDDIFA